MELSKNDTKMTQGIAIVFMVLLHLFCRVDNLPYECLKIGGVPLVYYIGLFADQCVAIYCFCSGYATRLISDKTASAKDYYIGRLKSILRLLINYWIVLILFSIVGLATKNEVMPNSIIDFAKHFFLIEKSYNGAWWFVLIYILLVLSSRVISVIIDKIHPIIINVLLLGLYVVAYYQRIVGVINFNNQVLSWFINKVIMYIISLLPFVWGMYFYKYKLFTKIRTFIDTKKIPNAVVAIASCVVILVMIVGHGIVPNEMVQVFTGIVTIVLFNIVKKGKALEGVLLFLGKHSTNIWLTHMFFYNVLFVNFVFIAKYPIAIFVFMMALTIGSSYIINLINKPLSKLVK